MRSLIRLLFVPVVAGLVVAGAGLIQATTAEGASPRVVMVDNDGPLPNVAMDSRTGEWGFAPAHIAVSKGEMVTFVNPQGNFRPHNVVSITRTGTAYPVTIESGKAFDSSPTREQLVTPGNSWVLDTSGLTAGHYGYMCTLHVWMVGSITVVGQ